MAAQWFTFMTSALSLHVHSPTHSLGTLHIVYRVKQLLLTSRCHALERPYTKFEHQTLEAMNSAGSFFLLRKWRPHLKPKIESQAPMVVVPDDVTCVRDDERRGFDLYRLFVHEPLRDANRARHCGGCHR